MGTNDFLLVHAPAMVKVNPIRPAARTDPAILGGNFGPAIQGRPLLKEGGNDGLAKRIGLVLPIQESLST